MISLSQTVATLLSNYYRCPQFVTDFELEASLSYRSGYFRLNEDLVCYGRLSTIQPAATPYNVPNVCHRISNGARRVTVPFDAAEVVSNLRLERYNTQNGIEITSGSNIIRQLYYLVRPVMPVYVRKYLQRCFLRGWDRIPFPSWPVDRSVDRLHEWLLGLVMEADAISEVPFVWFWPDGSPSCISITHDVETSAGRDFCVQLMDINDSYGIKSSFQVVPEERYAVSSAFLDSLRYRGFEVNIHDLNHDGHLFRTREQFHARVSKINRYGKEFRSRGFRSGALYRKQEWMRELDFAYDMSVPNVAHLDPQRGGCCTIMPFFFARELVEIPVTTTQDYTLFHILHDYSTRLWEEQVWTISRAHGMATFIIHPDYIIEHRAQTIYKQLLTHLTKLREAHGLWIATPGEINDWWRARALMQVVKEDGRWRVRGEGSERARVAYARIKNNRVVYRVDQEGTSSTLEGHGELFDGSR